MNLYAGLPIPLLWVIIGIYSVIICGLIYILVQLIKIHRGLK